MPSPSEVLGLGTSVCTFREKQFSPQPTATGAVRETVTGGAVSEVMVRASVMSVTVCVAAMVVVPAMAEAVNL